MRKWLGYILNIAFVIFIGFMIYQRTPEIYFHYVSENKPAPKFQAHLLNGNEFDSKNIQAPLVLVFWATWCAPCKLELARINNMILDKSLDASSVLAISSFENEALLLKTSKERGYQFPIASDSNGRLAEVFQVDATPTVLLLNKSGEIEWFSSGLSPLLEFRINNLAKLN